MVLATLGNGRERQWISVSLLSIGDEDRYDWLHGRAFDLNRREEGGAGHGWGR